MAFIEELPTWNNPGQKPPSSKITEGWKPQDHPPADWLNWLFTTCYEALYELQQNALHMDQKAAPNGLASLVGGKIPLGQLANMTSDQLTRITAVTDADIAGSTYPTGITFFTITQGSKNYPLEYGSVLNINSSGSRFNQLFFSPGSPGASTIWFRNWYNTGWTPWQQVETTAGSQAKANQAKTDAVAQVTAVAQMKKITRDDGGAIISLSSSTDDLLAAIVAAGTGMNSIYCTGTAINTPPSNKSVRGISFLSSPTYGFVMAVDSDEKLFVNHLDNGTWRGWVQQASTATATTSADGLMSKADKAKLDGIGQMPSLWEGAMFVLATQTITPTKALSACRTGWILVWSDYDPGSGAKSNDFNWALSYIPKSIASIDKGGGIYVPIVRFIDSSAVKITAKTLYVDNASFTGDADNSNSTIETDDVCLRYVYEF